MLLNLQKQEREKSDSLRKVAVIAQENAEYDKILALDAATKHLIILRMCS